MKTSEPATKSVKKNNGIESVDFTMCLTNPAKPAKRRYLKKSKIENNFDFIGLVPKEVKKQNEIFTLLENDEITEPWKICFFSMH